MYKNTFLRFCIVVALPLLASVLFIFPFGERIDLINNNGTVTINPDEIFRPSPINTIRTILSTPFDLQWYNICFEDLGTERIEEPENFFWTVEVDKKENLTVYSNGKNCTLKRLDKPFTYNWRTSGILTLSYEDIGKPKHFFKYINTTSYAEAEPSSLVAKNILFIFSFWTIVILVLAIKGIISNSNPDKGNLLFLKVSNIENSMSNTPLKLNIQKIAERCFIGLLVTLTILVLIAFVLSFIQRVEWTQIQLASLGGIASASLFFLIWLQLKEQSKQVDLLKQQMEPKILIHREYAKAYVILNDENVEETINLDKMTKERAKAVCEMDSDNLYTKIIKVHMVLVNPSDFIVTINHASAKNIVKNYTAKKFISGIDIFPEWSFDLGKSFSITPNNEIDTMLTFKFNKKIPLSEAKFINVSIGFAGKERTTGLMSIKYVVNVTQNEYTPPFELSLEELQKTLKQKFSL